MKTYIKSLGNVLSFNHDWLLLAVLFFNTQERIGNNELGKKI